MNCTAALPVFVANDNVIELRELRNSLTNAYINNASVFLSIRNAAGGLVEGVTWPVPMIYVDNSRGNYRVVVGHDVQFLAGQMYEGQVTANADDRDAQWNIPLAATSRGLFDVTHAVVGQSISSINQTANQIGLR